MRTRTIAGISGLTLGLLLASCEGDKRPAGASDKPAATATTRPAAPNPACPPGENHGPLRWIEDDYAGALACARATKRPLVIDMWAPWCHTCLSMQSTVMIDPSLAPLADRFVFLALDTDRPTNAGAVARYPLNNWPTFFVVEPQSETVQGRWLGAASIGQLRGFLKDGETATLAAMSGKGLDPVLTLVRAGDQAAVAKDAAAADRAYGEALAAAPADWPRRSDVLVAQIAARKRKGDTGACLDLALGSAAQTGNTANATDFLVWALMCAEAKDADAARAKAVRELAVTRLRALLADASAPLSVDDRSDAMYNLREAVAALGDVTEARAIATRQLELLTEAAGKAPNPMAAMTFNWPRAEVHVFLDRGKELVPALEKSAADLPTEYDPPYRLAWVLMKSGDAAAALPWIEKATALTYGARKVRVLGLAVDLAKATGDRDRERAARTALVATLTSLPAGQEQPEALAKAQTELAAMDAPTKPVAAP